jgi:quercetin dioxygenase-like cupin family protein
MWILLTAALCIFAFQTTAPQSTPALPHRIVLPADIKWNNDGDGFFSANRLGNSANPGFYMILVKAQDGATLPPHWHSRDENVTVLSGTFLVGIGDSFDEHALQAVPTGGYLFIPGNVHHFVKSKGNSLGSFGEGPLTFSLVPAAEMQRLAKMLVGKWKVDEDWAPGGSMPNCGKGTGHSVIEPGPGGSSLIEDFVSSSPAAHLHSLIWWEKAGKVFRTFSCDDYSDEGCKFENGRGHWEGNEVVWQLTVPKDGKDVPAKIVWAEKDSGSFAAMMYVADASGTLKRDWTFLHTREVVTGK